MLLVCLWLLIVLGAFLLIVAWRILRCVEWLAMFAKGFSEKFVERSREIDAEQSN
jgi:hypothetical protein